MKITNLLAGLAAGSFLLAQPAAAATRSYESLPQSGIQHPVSVDRAGAPVNGAEQIHGAPFLAIILIFAALIAIFALTGVFDKGKDSTG